MRNYSISILNCSSIKRWNIWPTMEKANALLEAMCRKDDRLVYVDIAAPMLDAEGLPMPGIFKKDKLHMTRSGYVIWRDTLKPILEN